MENALAHQAYTEAMGNLEDTSKGAKKVTLKNTEVTRTIEDIYSAANKLMHSEGATFFQRCNSLKQVAKTLPKMSDTLTSTMESGLEEDDGVSLYPYGDQRTSRPIWRDRVWR